MFESIFSRLAVDRYIPNTMRLLAVDLTSKGDLSMKGIVVGVVFLVNHACVCECVW